MRILDTDILTHLFEGTPRVVEALELVRDDVRTTVINRVEILRARSDHLLKAADGQQLLRAQSLLDRTTDLLARFPTVPIDSWAAARFDVLRQQKRLRKIGRADLLIASITLSCNGILITRNVRDFSLVPGLDIENWLD